MQVLLLNVPAGVPLEVKVTVPVGVIALPPLASLTVAVQVVVLFTGSVDGLQVTTVVVLRWVTARPKVPLLPLCLGSPP